MAVHYWMPRLVFCGMRLPPGATLFPYTTLFRSLAAGGPVVRGDRPDGPDLVPRARHPDRGDRGRPAVSAVRADRKSTRLNSSHPSISYAVFCLKKKNRLV